MHADVLNVDLGDRGYPIYIGSGLLGDAALLRRHLDSGPVALVSNVTVAPLYLERVKAALGERLAVVKLLPDGEQHKTLDVLATIYDALLESRCDRRTTVVALGGGVVGDMSGFAAATYQRGVSFLQLPTTLLAQVDSSVGGKTGVNHPRGKNMIGAFHQPRCVIADTDTLATLPAREFAAGVAEVIKYGLIGDLGFYRWLQAHSDTLVQRDPRILAQAIRRSCENKARVVAADEREEGLRALLNFGHTFAHAIETATAYGVYLHGEAVAIGMLMAAEFSSRLGWIAPAEVEGLRALLLATGLPVQPPSGIDPSRFLELMAADKKVAAGRIRLVLLRALGEAVVSAEFPPEELQALLRDNLRAAAAASSS
ncbi:MAG: 3-dehydroquinate synthase [Gammaproteobacteria bacterium]|nr:3-dehydroquinate synthase [Gammaproteobacteria bacterium]